MKQFKLFFACALMSLLSLGQVWADTAEFTYSDLVGQGTSGSGSAFTGATDGDITMGGVGNGNSSYTQIYGSGTLTFTPLNGATITQIVIEATSSGYIKTWSSDPAGVTVSDKYATWEGSSTGKVTLTNTASGQARIKSMTVTYTAGSTTKCATPTFLPAAGSYEGTQNVTISSTTGSTIYYTTDESDPKTSGTRQTYSTAIPVSANTTLKAYAVKDGLTDSDVETAAYTITEGPDVTINLLDAAWNFPTSKVVEETSYTDGVYTIKVAGTTGQGFRTYGTYFLLGQNGAYLELPAFTNPIEKIVVAGNSNGSASVTWNIYKGDDAVSTEATGCKNDAYTFNIDPLEASVVYRLKVTNSANLQIKTIKIYYGAAPAVAKPTISGDENFVTSTTVTITHADADAIYYTTDGSDPKTSGAKQTYSVPFTVNADGTTTVKAYAVKGSDESDVAEKEFTKVSALSTMAEVQAAATSTDETAINVAISNWVVTAVSGNQVWFTAPDNLKGILLYKSSHGFTAGNKLNGLVVGTKIKLFNNYPELTSLVAGDVAITTADAITARTTTIAALTSGHPAEQGTIVKLENLTYTASSTSFSDGANSIQIDSKLYSPALVDGASYTITGVVEYLASNVIKIMPRSADDVEGGAALPEVTGLAALKAEATGVSYLLNLTDAVVTLVDGSNAFIEDATAGALIYKSGHGFNAGDKLNGQYEVTTTTYHGKFEITAITATTGTKTTGAAIPETTLTIAQLNANFAANESKRIKIVGVNVTDAVESGDATARTGEISDGVNTITLYAGKSGVTAAENANIDVIGYPTYHNTDEQLAVWAQADITVNVKDDPELSYSPASVNLTVGDALSALTFNNPHTLSPITYSTDNDAVATVDEYGAIALAGGTGTAVITASYAGDPTYNAGNATFTITVSAYDPRKLATGSAFTDISGDLTPNDITYAAYKGDGTANPVVRSGDDPVTIRIYKPATGKTTGGYLTVTAIAGCTIDQVQITFSGSATAAYSINDAELPTDAYITGEAVLLTPTALNAQSVSIVNLKNGSIDIAEIKVWYNGEGLPDPELSYSPASDEITLGDAWFAPTFNNPHSVTITSYASDNEAVATVTDGGVIALAGGTGTANITASFDGNASYKAGSATYTIIVNAPAPVLTGTTYTKVTSTGDITDGEYLIVYETENVAFNGDLATLDAAHNTVDVVISGSEIAGTADIDAAVFTLDVANGTIQAHNGNYIGVTTYGNGLKQNAEVTTYPAHTFEIDGEGNAIISIYGDTWNSGGEGYMILNYNDGASDKRFRYYKAGSQKKIQLYKKEVVTPTPDYTRTEMLGAGVLGTICVDHNVTSAEGATFYEVSGLNGSQLVLAEVTGELEAGVPYVFQATGNVLNLYYGATSVAEPVNTGALKGTFSETTIENTNPNWANIYYFANHALYSCSDLTSLTLPANRAYLVMSQVGGFSPMPGRRYFTVNVNGKTTPTGMEEITNDQSQMTNKVIIDGHLYILRGEKMYDATGRLVK